MLGQALAVMDENDDGVVSLSEVESSCAKFWERGLLWSRRFHDCSKHPLVRVGVGWTLLSYGGHFKQLAVMYASLEATHFTLLTSEFARLKEAYATVRSRLRIRNRHRSQGQGGPDADVAGALVIARKMSGGMFEVPVAELVAAVGDPRPLIEVLVRIHGASVACLCAVLNDNAARLGIGVHFGQRLAAVVTPTLVNLILGPEDVSDEAAMENIDITIQQTQSSADGTQLARDAQAARQTQVLARPGPDPSRIWVEIGLEGVCTALGLALAYWLRSWAALWTACGLGGRMTATALCDVCDVTPGGGSAFFGSALGGLGFAFHLRHGGHPSIPKWLQLPLAGPRLLEFGLTALTADSKLSGSS